MARALIKGFGGSADGVSEIRTTLEAVWPVFVQPPPPAGDGAAAGGAAAATALFGGGSVDAGAIERESFVLLDGLGETLAASLPAQTVVRPNSYRCVMQRCSMLGFASLKRNRCLHRRLRGTARLRATAGTVAATAVCVAAVAGRSTSTRAIGWWLRRALRPRGPAANLGSLERLESTRRTRTGRLE